MIELHEWIARSAFTDRPWLILGKGPTYQRRGEFDLARVAQQPYVGTQNDRQFASVDAEAVDQGLRAGIGLWVEPLVWMPVAGEEPFEAQNITIIGAADDDRAAGAERQQADAAQDQGAHDALAELRLFHHQIAQPPRRNDDRLCRFRGNGVDQGRAVG